MTTEIICYENLPNAPKAVGPYSPVVKVGSFYYLSGQVGLNPETGALVGTGIEEQTNQALTNLEAVLRGVGLSFQHVVKTVIFLTDLPAHFQTVNGIYGTRLGGHKPARSTIQVAGLPLGAIVEIEMIAVGS